MAIVVDAFVWDEENESHCMRHGLTPFIAEEVRSRAPLFFLNKKRTTGSHLMIGPALNGRFWAVVILKQDNPGLWRPITGWPSSERQIVLYNEKLRQPKRRKNTKREGQI